MGELMMIMTMTTTVTVTVTVTVTIRTGGIWRWGDWIGAELNAGPSGLTDALTS